MTPETPPSPLQQLLEKNVNRKEFLAYMGAALFAVVGLKGILNALLGPSTPPARRGYGSGTYGDPKR